MTDNMEIWNRVFATDPAFTKKIEGKGYRGTSTNSTYLARKATEVFGPCGIGWGVRVLDERILEGAPLGEGFCEKVHRVHIKLWYMLDGVEGAIEHFGQTTFAGKNKNGFYTDEEAPKKSLTDAMTKALSLLGFAADIHLGMYDDNRYVNDLKRAKTANEEPISGPSRLSGAPPSAATETKADYIRWCHETIDGWSDTAAQLKVWWHEQANARKRFRLSIPEERALFDRMVERGKAIAVGNAQPNSLVELVAAG